MNVVPSYAIGESRISFNIGQQCNQHVQMTSSNDVIGLAIIKIQIEIWKGSCTADTDSKV